ncbi:MAG: radical SAM protein [Deltaproteobacteria bacterium]|nr:radical SAM protein [Deltaproteobacteria bacterium]
MRSKSFHIITLGCKVNQYESEALREAWLKAGHRELPAPDGADVVLINSCAITAKAVSDLRATARRVRRAAPDCELLVTGCAAQALPEELNELPVDGLVPQREKVALLRWLGNADGFEAVEINTGEFPEHHPESAAEHNHEHDPKKNLESDEFWDYEGPEEVLEERAFPAFSISDYARSRAVLKIHDGCSQHCTYCIVPMGRGPSVSRPWPEILAEAGRLVSAGFREIVLNGVNLRQYGADLPPEAGLCANMNNIGEQNGPGKQKDSGGRRPDFWDLLTRLETAFAPEWAKSGALRFRISSLEPGQLGQKALETLSRSRLVAPHLHLSLQSGSPHILRRMGRGHYDPALLPDFLDALGKIWPVYGLGADFITGFPGETEENFEETLELCRRLPLTYAHVFPYSKRPGTAAARLPSQLSQTVKKERAARLRELIATKKSAFLQRQLGLDRVWVALEEGRAGQGINEFYSDCRFDQGALPHGKRLIAARPMAVADNVLIVERI